MNKILSKLIAASVLVISVFANAQMHRPHPLPHIGPNPHIRPEPPHIRPQIGQIEFLARDLARDTQNLLEDFRMLLPENMNNLSREERAALREVRELSREADLFLREVRLRGYNIRGIFLRIEDRLSVAGRALRRTGYLQDLRPSINRVQRDVDQLRFVLRMY